MAIQYQCPELNRARFADGKNGRFMRVKHKDSPSELHIVHIDGAQGKRPDGGFVLKSALLVEPESAGPRMGAEITPAQQDYFVFQLVADGVLIQRLRGDGGK